MARRRKGRGNDVAPTTVPADLAAPIATTGDGRDITQPWIRELQEARDPRLIAAADWGVYERVRKDAQVKSCMEQRIRAVVSREWDVLPGDEEDPRSVEAGDALKAAIERAGWDRVTEKMLWAPFYGYAVGELMWGAADGLLTWLPTDRCRPIHVRHARRFRYSQQGELRLLTRNNPRGETLPDRKFWIVTAGGTNDDESYGEGLADWLYFPVLFKRNGLRFWNIFLDKHSVPTAKGTYPRGTSKADIDKLLAAIGAIANDSGFAIPEGMTVELLQLAQSGADFGAVCRYMDGEIAKIILSQTMTTDNGSSRAQGQVHADVKLEIVKADADLLSDSFNAGPARWFTDLNFGADVASPRLVRIVEEEDDLKAAADTDQVLKTMGWVRTDESFRDRYGDGYEPAPPPATPPGGEPAEGTGEPGTPVEGKAPDQADNVVQLRATAFAAADPKPLYIYRRLLNAGDVIEWARGQGFTSLQPASELHVTVAYSRRPVNWFTIAGDIPPGSDLRIEGGPRIVDRIGDQGAIALHFASGDLVWRNRAMREAGASWDFADYHPHLTLTYQGATLDLGSIEPYRGPLVFGPEVFEAIQDGWHDQVQEIALAEPLDGDVVDEVVAEALADDGWSSAWSDMVDPLIDRLMAASSQAEVDAILADVAGGDAPDALSERLARAGFALRIDALTGGEG